mmetsp:Transcript_18116/g.45251  ORF Transcript_18116/g.45251 Transcript_18116/m.45251 type:complete len:259 (-) Transcript_18116:39-815(-)
MYAAGMKADTIKKLLAFPSHTVALLRWKGRKTNPITHSVVTAATVTPYITSAPSLAFHARYTPTVEPTTSTTVSKVCANVSFATLPAPPPHVHLHDTAKRRKREREERKDWISRKAASPPARMEEGRGVVLKGGVGEEEGSTSLFHTSTSEVMTVMRRQMRRDISTALENLLQLPPDFIIVTPSHLHALFSASVLFYSSTLLLLLSSALPSLFTPPFTLSPLLRSPLSALHSRLPTPHTYNTERACNMLYSSCIRVFV